MVWAYQPATMVSRCPVMYQTKLWCRSGFGGFQDRFIDAFLAPSKENVLRGLELQHFNPLIRPNMSCFLFVSRFPRGRSNPGEPVPGSVTSWRWFLQGNEQCTFQVMDISACFVGLSLVWMICHGHNLPRGSNWGPTKADSWLSLKVNARCVVTFRGLPGKELRVTGILHRMTMFFAKWSSLVSQKSLEPP